MIERVKDLNNVLKVFILIFFIFAIGYFVFAFLGSLFKKEPENRTQVDIENIQQYTKNENTDEDVYDSQVVKNYSKFYTIQNAMQNFVDSLIKGEYSDSYSVLSNEMKDKYSKKEYLEKIEKLQKQHFPVDDPDYMYINNSKLMNATKISEAEEYLVDYMDVEGKTVKFGIRLNTDKKEYSIFYIEL